MGGYWATGRTIRAIAPARVMTIDRTEAKIGRSMKKCEIMGSTVRDDGSWLGRGRGGRVAFGLGVLAPGDRRVLGDRHGGLVRLDHHLRADELDAADDDPLARLEPAFDHAK